MNIKTALLTVLDHVDYTRENCRINEMVGAVLPVEIIQLARKALTESEELEMFGKTDSKRKIVFVKYESNPKRNSKIGKMSKGVVKKCQ